MAATTSTANLFGRPLTAALVLLTAALQAAPAEAVVGGVKSRSADGVRASTLRIETSRGELCSGAVISSELILTAAHCLMTGGAVRVISLDRRFRSRTQAFRLASIPEQRRPHALIVIFKTRRAAI